MLQAAITAAPSEPNILFQARHLLAGLEDANRGLGQIRYATNGQCDPSSAEKADQPSHISAVLTRALSELADVHAQIEALRRAIDPPNVVSIGTVDHQRAAQGIANARY